MRTPSPNQLVFLVFFGLFFVTAPLVVLYTAGYRWQPSRGVLRTGTLFVSSVPDNATIFLNEEKMSDRTPAVIKTLLPGEYNVRLEREGHMAWEKTLPVHENTTTFIDRVLLFAKSAPRLLIREPVARATWSQDGKYVAWAQTQEGWSEVWISTLESPASRLVSRMASSATPELAWDGDVLTITVGDNVRAVTVEGLEVVPPLPEPTPVELVPATSYTDVFYNGSFLARLPNGTYTIADTRGSYITLIDRAHDRLFLLTSADREAPLLLQEDAIFFDWVRRDALAFGTPYSISMYEPSKHTTTLVTRISEPLHALMWHPDGGYIFYATDHEVRAIELDDRDGRRVTSLASLPIIETFSMDPRGRTLYLVGNDGMDQGVFVREITER